MEKTFEYDNTQKEIDIIRDEIKALSSEKVLTEPLINLENNLVKLYNNDKLRIVVCGQYSAGKSSLISVLTKNTDIKIGQAVTTDQVTTYEWNGIQISDTPGICAGHPEHDERSLEAIKNADLLIYMVTIQGFSSVIGDNFKALILGKYPEKTMLLMNKRSQESEENEPYWREDVNKFLGDSTGTMLKKLHFSIIDVEDYKMGIEDNDKELIQCSHFEDFLFQLNLFIQEKKLTAKLRSKLDVIIQELETLINDFNLPQGTDQFTKRKRDCIENALRKCNDAFDNAQSSLKFKIKDCSDNLVGYLNEETIDQFKQKADAVDSELDRAFECEELKNEIKDIINELNDSLKKIDDDAEEYMNRLNNSNKNVSLTNLSSNIGNKINTKDINLDAYKQGAKISRTVLDKITKEGLSKVVHFLGGKFKPWGATKCMTWIGKTSAALGWLGVALQVAQPFLKQDMGKKREELRSAFKTLETKMVDGLNEFKNGDDSVYQNILKLKNQIDNQINEQKQNEADKQRLLPVLEQIKQKALDLQKTI